MSEGSKQPAYWTYATKSSLDSNQGLDKEFYSSVSKEENKTLVKSFEIPIRSGQAWELKKGQLCRVVTIRGGQVGDLNLWNLYNPRERLWAARSRQLQRSHVSTLDQLWSNLPYLRPMMTITGDSLSNYGVDEDGGRCHDLLGTRCDPYVNKLLMGEDFDFCCHSNLVRAVLPYGLTEFDVHDVLNVFQITGLSPEGKYFMKKSPAKKGDFFEFFAEIDLLCALSVCPGGDLSLPLWGENACDPVEVCNPLGIEIYDVNPNILSQWKPFSLDDNTKYKTLHGITLPKWKTS